jgi:hypothetical protein
MNYRWNLRMVKISFSFIILMSTLFNCSRPTQDTPEGTLNLFIQERFSDSNEEQLMKYFTNDFKLKLQVELKESLDQAVPQADSVAEVEFKKKYKKKDFSISKMNCDKTDQCVARYILEYFTVNDKDQKQQFLTETKKVAILKKVDGQWLIDDVEHLKTYHESLEQIEIKAQ